MEITLRYLDANTVNLAEENKFIRDRNEKIDISHNIYDNVSDRLSNVKCQMSFMYILNKRGPRMDPCGIPESVFDHPLNLLFTLVLCFLPEM